MLLRGTVTDNEDPMQRGRCRVHIWGMHQEHDPNLPWAEVLGTTHNGLHQGVGSASVLQVGTTVWVMFEQSEIQCPVIVGTFVGHSGETMADIKPETSDFPDSAKGDKYGKVVEQTTPCGHRFAMDCTDGSIQLTTPQGFGINASDEKGELTLNSPCGLEIKMDCNSGKIYIKGDIVTDGHITANGVFAPNLCYCNSPGPNSPVTGGVESGNGGDPGSSAGRQKAQQKQCDPQVSEDGRTTCNNDFPLDNDVSKLKEKMQRLLAKAKELYKDKHGQEFNVCETNMSVERYECLRKAGLSYPEQLVCGLAVYAVPHTMDCTSATAGADRSETPAGSGVSAEEACGKLPSDSYASSKIKSAENPSAVAKWQGWQAGPVKGLTDKETKAMTRLISFTESTHNPKADNGTFFGEFQFGIPALYDAGYVRVTSGRSSTARGNIWTGKDGANSYADFVGNRTIQQNAAKTMWANNLKYAMSGENRVAFSKWWNQASGRERMGFYYASQFGWSRAVNWVVYGQDSKDGNKVNTSSYYNSGVGAYDRWVCGA